MVNKCYTDDFDIVWNGGPLLPERPTIPDGRWNGMPVVDDLVLKIKPNETRNSKAYYKKISLQYWSKKGDFPLLAPTDTMGSKQLKKEQ